MKKLLSLLLCLCLLCGFAPMASAQNANALPTIRALGIMKGDQNGSLNLDKPVSRAEFVTMMTSASKFKDTLSPEGSGFSLFSDVKNTHWASEYIRLAVSEGWFVGYTDGSFRPGETITLEEGCTALLRLLGYDSSSLAGTFPQAQLNKAHSLGLREEMSPGRGDKLLRSDCVQLFYNLLTVQNAQGQTHAVTLGYTVVNGEVDYLSVAKENLVGPFVAKEDTRLSFAPSTVYRNGEVSADAKLKANDVYYYNEAVKTLWVYTEKTTGRISAIAPSLTAPASVTVAGESYTLDTPMAKYALSALGGGAVGQVVTLLLGMDGTVVSIITGDAVETVYCGVVQGDKTVLDESGSALEKQVTLFCTDGKVRSFTLPVNLHFTEGDLIAITVTADGNTMERLKTGKLEGKVNAGATKLGDLPLSERVEILDTTEEGDAITVKPARLAGATLKSADIRYYNLNAEGEIQWLILNDVTGDLWQYGYMTGVKDNSRNMSVSVQYRYLMDGTETTKTLSTNYSAKIGGMAIRFDASGNVRSIKNTTATALTSVGATTAKSVTQSFTLGDDLQVYLQDNGLYLPVKLGDLSTATHNLTGYFDGFGCAAGGRIRVIIASPK